MPCIARDDMPQVDLHDYPALHSWLRHHGVVMVHETVSPHRLSIRQCMPGDIKFVSSGNVRKPALVSEDYCILDGNYRWLWNLHCGHATMPILRLRPCEFSVGRSLLLAFPKAYRYGDGRPHPLSY